MTILEHEGLDGATRRRAPTYQVLVEDIKALGVEQVFGLMSDDTAVFATALDSSGVRFYGARHENNAIAMAEGFAYATDGLGIAVIGRGPATANGLHAATYASRTGSRVLIIYGEAAVPTGAANSLGPDYKGFNATGVLSAAGIRTFVATSAVAARGALADAAAAALQGGVAALLLPVDVQLAEMDLGEGAFAAAPKRALRPPTPPRSQAIEAAIGLLRQSRKPLILAGQGAYRARARAALEQLAERTGALLATSARGKDLFRGHPCNLGIIGSFSHSAARRLVAEADCVLVFGASLNLLTMSFGHSLPKAPLIQVDASRGNIGRWHAADVAVVGDARLAAEALLEALPAGSNAERPFRSEETRRFLGDFDIARDFQPANTTRTVDPRALGVALDKLLPPRRNLVYDAGNFLGIVPYLSVPDPGHFKMTSDFASIGLGFGAALGVARARPDETTVLVIGDGGFLMTMGELETAVREDLPLVIVLMNDCAYGAELHFLKMRDLPVAKSVFPDVDYAPIAEAFGFQAATIRTLDDLHKAAPMLARPDGPVFLDCKLNAAVAAPFMSEFHEFETRKH
ncbi:thiamine pyrophosphate-binding protein [Reyranella sp.]|uniref:thiamine pyrophosphate-binding protein n=1 Tax=Reyranella sp. TaxID=1929291 RepID=UPI002F95DBED